MQKSHSFKKTLNKTFNLGIFSEVNNKGLKRNLFDWFFILRISP